MIQSLRVLFPLAVLLFVPPIAAQQAKKVEATAVLKDGEIITGVLLDELVRIETDFGHAEIRVGKFASIKFASAKPHGLDEIVTLDRTVLRGNIVRPKSFRIKTTRETRKLHCEHLASIGVVSADGPPSFAGKWSTTFGPMQLSQVGNKVTGHYTYSEKKVEGTVEGGELSFTYEGGGKGKFTLWEGADGFSGDYTASNGRTGSWGGYRIRAAVAPPTPEEITSGQTKSWLNYHLRVPANFDKSKRYPAIAFLHGSNMTSRAYVNTIASVWPKLAAEYILVGFDGERINGSSTPDQRSYNYTYVNFSGHKVGSMFVYRQSPALVAEALDELKAHLPIDRWFLGGHSQGGFLTYAVFMFYPDAVAGVFPMSCNLLVQCDPDYHTNAELREKQREVAIAVVHGENDNVVEFSGGEWCYRAMVDGGFPMLRFFTDKNAAHMFARLPVESAVRWLESVTATDAAALVSFAEQQLKSGQFRDVAAALLRIRDLGVPADLRNNVRDIAAKLDAASRPESVRLVEAIRANKDNRWVDGFLEYREKFAFADAAKASMAEYAKLRGEHKDAADKLFYAARGIRDATAREDKYREIVQKYYASKWYAHVKGWIDQ